MRYQWMSRFRWVILGTSLFLWSEKFTHAEQELKRYEFLQIRMGIPVNIVFYAPDEPSANQAAAAAFNRIRQLDRIMSDYDPDSELMQLCSSSDSCVPTPVSPELFEVLKAALALSQESEGAFDITVGPIVKLWRVARRKRQLPTTEALEEALRHVGSQHVYLDEETRTVTLGLPDMQLDLGAIAKGYAADEALRVLREHGFPRALVEAGGDLTVGDPPPDADAWVIAIEPLRKQLGEQQKPIRLKLRNAAVATSGDTYQYLEVEDVRYSHIVDPRTGLGLTTPRSVTVVAPTGMLADGLASTVSVLGPEKGLPLIEQREKTEAFVVELSKDQQRRTWQSDGWDHLPRVESPATTDEQEEP